MDQDDVGSGVDGRDGGFDVTVRREKLGGSGIGEKLQPKDLVRSGESCDESCRDSELPLRFLSSPSTIFRMLRVVSSCVLSSASRGTICAYCSRDPLDCSLEVSS